MHTSPALFSRKFIPPFSVLLIGLIALLVKCWDLLLQRSETAPCNVYLPALAEVTSFHSSWRGTSHSHWAPMGSGWTQCCPSTKHPEEWITTPVEIVCIYVLLWVFICYCVYLFTCQSDCHILANMPNHTSGTTSSAFESFRLLFQNFPHWCYSDACTSQYILMYMCICIIYACLWIVYKPTQRLLVQWELLLLQTCAHCLVQEPRDAFHWCLLKSKHSCKNCNNQVAFSLLALVFFFFLPLDGHVGSAVGAVWNAGLVLLLWCPLHGAGMPGSSVLPIIYWWCCHSPNCTAPFLLCWGVSCLLFTCDSRWRSADCGSCDCVNVCRAQCVHVGRNSGDHSCHISVCEQLEAPRRVQTMGMGGWRQVAQPHPMLLQWLTFHSRKGIFLVRKKKNPQNKKRFFQSISPSAAHPEPLCRCALGHCDRSEGEFSSCSAWTNRCCH